MNEPRLRSPSLAWTLGAVWLLTGLLVAVLAEPVLYWDEWDHADAWLSSRAGGLEFATFWQPHNEHRPALARLLFYVVLELGLPPTVLALLSLAALGAALWLLRSLIVAAGAGLRAVWRVAFEIAIAALVLSWAQWENLLSPFQVGFSLAVLGAVLAARGLCDPPSAGAAWRLGGGLAIAFLSTPFWLALVPLVLVAVWRPGVSGPTTRWLRVAATGALLLAAAVYVRGLDRPAHHPRRSFVLEEPLEFLGFLPLLYGGAFADGGLALPLVMGGGFAVASAGWLALVVRRASRKQPSSGLDLLTLSILVFCHGAALMLAVGRAGLGPRAALASRYTSFMLIGWMALACAALRRVLPGESGFSPVSRRRRAGAAVLVGATLGLAMALSAARLHQVTFWTMPRRAAGRQCLEAVLADPALLESRSACLEALYPDPSRLVDVARRLRRR